MLDRSERAHDRANKYLWRSIKGFGRQTERVSVDSGGRTAPPPASTHHGCVVEKIGESEDGGNPNRFRVSKSTKSLELHSPWLARLMRPNCLLPD